MVDTFSLRAARIQRGLASFVLVLALCGGARAYAQDDNPIAVIESGTPLKLAGEWRDALRGLIKYKADLVTVGGYLRGTVELSADSKVYPVSVDGFAADGVVRVVITGTSDVESVLFSGVMQSDKVVSGTCDTESGESIVGHADWRLVADLTGRQ